MKKCIYLSLAMCLAAVPLTGASAQNVEASESSAAGFDPMDRSLTIGGYTYVFPVTVDELSGNGLNVEEPSYQDGYYYLVDVNDGRNTFTLRMELIGGAAYATGYQVEASDSEGIIASGIALDDITAEDLKAQLEELKDRYEYSISIYDNSIDVYTMSVNRIWNISLDGNQVKSVSFHDELPLEYGTDYLSAEQAPDDSAYDPSAFALNEFMLDGTLYGPDSTIQDLLDNGWYMTETDLETFKFNTLDPGYYTLTGVELFNGESMISVSPLNSSDHVETMVGSQIGSIEARIEWNSDITMADGVTLGSSFDEFVAVFGEPSYGMTFDVLSNQKLTVNKTDDTNTVYTIELR